MSEQTFLNLMGLKTVGECLHGACYNCSLVSSPPEIHGITHPSGRVHIQAWKTFNFASSLRSARARSGPLCLSGRACAAVGSGSAQGDLGPSTVVLIGPEKKLD